MFNTIWKVNASLTTLKVVVKGKMNRFIGRATALTPLPAVKCVPLSGSCCTVGHIPLSKLLLLTAGNPGDEEPGIGKRSDMAEAADWATGGMPVSKTNMQKVVK